MGICSAIPFAKATQREFAVSPPFAFLHTGRSGNDVYFWALPVVTVVTHKVVPVLVGVRMKLLSSMPVLVLWYYGVGKPQFPQPLI